MSPGDEVRVRFASIGGGFQLRRATVRSVRREWRTDKVQSIVVRLDKSQRLAVVSPRSIVSQP